MGIRKFLADWMKYGARASLPVAISPSGQPIESRNGMTGTYYTVLLDPENAWASAEADANHFWEFSNGALAVRVRKLETNGALFWGVDTDTTPATAATNIKAEIDGLQADIAAPPGTTARGCHYLAAADTGWSEWIIFGTAAIAAIGLETDNVTNDMVLVQWLEAP
jgi:hypothetical protein